MNIRSINDVEMLKDYSKEGKFLFIETSNKTDFSFKFVDDDGKDWIMGKQLNNRYRRVKRESIEKVNLEDL